MATIWERGPYQFCARVRRNGVSQTKTFETKSAAEEWARIIEGKVTGDEFQDRSLARDTSLSQACRWLADSLPDTPDAKNKRSKLRYWQGAEFASWSLVSLRPADLIRWRRDVLDEDGGGDEAECSAQTVIHRLNVLSQVYKLWSLAHDQMINNPVVDNVRPSHPRGRSRRLTEGEEWRLLNACRASSRPWLRPAVVIALETCMRQSELAGLTWDRVQLERKNRLEPHCDLLITKNGDPRRIPLSPRAIVAFRMLGPKKSGGVLPVETGRGIAHAFRDAVTDGAFPDLRWHDLRHEGISRLFERTSMRDHEIMAISGHLRPEMLARYTHLRADRLAAHLPGGRNNRGGHLKDLRPL